MKKAFTLIELTVAVGLLAMMISFASLIFDMSIDTHRTAMASAEIMQKLQAITGQLNADFKGIRTDAPLLIWFHQDSYPTDPNRYDQIMFFADGGFQSTQLYDNTGKPDSKSGDKLVTGNVARIHYGQAKSLDPADKTMKDPFALKEEDRLLAIRRHILTADTELDKWPEAGMTDFDEGSSTEDKDKYNECYEHDSLSLAQWETIDWGNDGDEVVRTCFWFRPLIDMNDSDTFHKLMCEGVGSFAIQWAYWDSGDERFYWFPSRDPDGDGDVDDSHFTEMDNKDEFGVYFNVPSPINDGDWYLIEDVEYKNDTYFSRDFYPKAFKFTFTLYDSRGVLEDGKTYTHIVYLGD